MIGGAGRHGACAASAVIGYRPRMALVRGIGIRGLWVAALVHAIACSEDGVSATIDDPSNGGTTGAATMSGTDATVTGTTAESSNTDTSPESSGPGSGATTAVDTSSTESGTGDPSGPCVEPTDCQIVDNCCECTAIAADAEAPVCEKTCLQSACAALGIVPIARCELGMCELGEASCDPSFVTCEQEPPVCPEGALPGVNPQTSCWTGECVPQEFCDVVAGGCDACEEGEVCVENVAQMVSSMCVPIPPDCNGTATCECMGEVCPEPFDVCADDGDGIECICIAC